jgi:hypothetical protein
LLGDHVHVGYQHQAMDGEREKMLRRLA